jgi:hypothetical protein
MVIGDFRRLDSLKSESTTLSDHSRAELLRRSLSVCLQLQIDRTGVQSPLIRWSEGGVCCAEPIYLQDQGLLTG